MRRGGAFGDEAPRAFARVAVHHDSLEENSMLAVHPSCSAAFVLVSLIGSAPALGHGAGNRLVSPDPATAWTAESLATFDDRWLHLKFIEGLDVQLVPAANASGFALRDLTGRDLTEVNAQLENAVTIRSTFPGDRERFRRWKAIGEQASGRPGPDLGLWFDAEVEGGRDALAALLNALNSLDVIEVAHGAPICEPAAIHAPAPVTLGPEFLAASMSPFFTPDFTNQQTYLFATPTGLDAPSAWARAGGRGTGIKFIDVELGWIHAHEDFDPAKLFHNNGNNDPSSGYRDHGTAVVGEVVGVGDNGLGITGIADDAHWGTVGILIGEWPNVPHRFLEAVEALDPGDAWLIELQMFPSGRNATPMEWLQVNYDVIWTSSWSLNVVCVEAGANGSQNLDDASWGGVFDRDVRDSGAIMVGAGTPVGRVAEGFTNYGSRMDASAWGSSIVTTGYGDLYSEGPATTEYTAGFGGTSGASPMVTGSVLCIQGIALDTLGRVLAPAEIRQLLTDTGIPNLGSRYIGPRPDLAAAVAAIDDMAGASLDSFSIVRGALLSGDVDDLRMSDDEAVHVRSGFGNSFLELHSMILEARATTSVAAPSTITITVESRIDEPSGTLRILLRNWNTSQFEPVGSFSVGMTDTVRVTNAIDAADYVNVAGEIDVQAMHVFFIPVFAYQFESWIDHVGIEVE